MSEMAPERPAPRRENVLTRRIGPLPTWAWVAIVGGGIVVWAVWKRRTAGATTSGGADASQVPQFVNQTYTTVSPPVAGPPGPPGPPHPPPITIPWHRGHPPSGGPPVRTERLRHKGNLQQIATRNHIDLEDLLEANPELRKYEGTGRQLPVGTVVRIPPAGT